MPDTRSIQSFIHSYEASVDNLARHMQRAVERLDWLHADQDEMVRELRKAFAKLHSLRHHDFNAILRKAISQRRHDRDSLADLVEKYRHSQKQAIGELKELFSSDVDRAVREWPELKTRVLDKRDGAAEVIAAFRRVHVEQEELSAAMSNLLERADKIDVSDLKELARAVNSRNSRERADLAGILATCESAALNAAMTWERLAG